MSSTLKLGSLRLLALAWFSATPALAQGLAIEHKELGCVVAEKYPRLVACFTPHSQVARARVYFRAEGTPRWFYVDMTSDAPCFRGILPKPSRRLHRFNYYVSGMDRGFREAQTQEYAPEVVPDGASCKKGLLAPFVNNASVVVGSAGGAGVATGFLGGGLSTAIVVGGAAVVGGGVAVGVTAGGGGDPGGGVPTSTLPSPTTLTTSPTTTLAGPTTTTLPGATTTTTTLLGPTTTTTTTLPGSPTTTSTLPGPTTTTLPGPTTTTLPGPTTTTTTLTPATTTTTTLPTCSGDLGPPTVQFVYPPNGDITLIGSLRLAAQASDPDGGPVTVTYSLDSGIVLGSSTSAPDYPVIWQPCGLLPVFKLLVQAVDRCGNASAVDTRNVVILGMPLCTVQATTPAGSLAISQLTAPGGRGQIVVNGSDGAFVGPGLARLPVRFSRGANQVEATLVSGGSGTWRFDLSGLGVAGSLRVVAGEVAQVGPEQVVFRLRGLPGERVVFTFRSGAGASPRSSP